MNTLTKNILLVAVYTISFICIYALRANAEEPSQVVTVKMTVERGDLVNESNLTMMHYNNKKIPADMIVNIQDAANLQALRTLRPGMQLRYTYLREMPMVAKNKLAKAVYNVPGIKLESEVQILQDGQEGDVVKAKNLKSGSIINVVVIGQNLVTVK